jgi:hypothetical protein
MAMFIVVKSYREEIERSNLCAFKHKKGNFKQSALACYRTQYLAKQGTFPDAEPVNGLIHGKNVRRASQLPEARRGVAIFLASSGFSLWVE